MVEPIRWRIVREKGWLSQKEFLDGLAPEVTERADIQLEPVRGPSNYNHLSVRSAAAVILDRLRGARYEGRSSNKSTPTR